MERALGPCLVTDRRLDSIKTLALLLVISVSFPRTPRPPSPSVWRPLSAWPSPAPLQVLAYEVEAVRQACRAMDPSGNYCPRITYIIVQKRHHTRLYPADNNCDRNGNVMPGTVVDRTICHPREFDFYLNSHASIQVGGVGGNGWGASKRKGGRAPDPVFLQCHGRLWFAAF